MASTYAGYGVYYYESTPPYPGHGMAGTISDDGSTVAASPDLQTGLNGDPITQGFIDNNGFSPALRLAVTDRIGSATSDDVNIYDPSSGSLIATISGGWTGVTNPYAIVPLGSYFYVLDYDNARIVELDSSYATTGISYTLPSSLNPDPSTYTAYGQSLFLANGELYAVFIFMNPTTFAFASTSLLVKFTISGGISIGVSSGDSNSNFASNTVAAAWDGSSTIYTAAIGGSTSAGSYNNGSAVQSISISGSIGSNAVNTLLSGSTSHTNFLDISIDTTTAGGPYFYVLAGYYNGSWQMNGALLKGTSIGSLSSIIPVTSASGYFWAAQYTPDNDRIWFGFGNSILIYDASSPSSPAANLTFGSGTPGWNLISAGEPYTTLNGFSYVGAAGFFTAHGAQSPIQVSHAPRAQRARSFAQGRPGLTEEELALLNSEFGKK